MKSTLLLLSLLVVTIENAEAVCNEVTVDACMRGTSVAKYSIKNMRVMQTDTIDDTCRIVEIINKCVVDLGCKETDPAAVLIWYGTRDAYRYICNDARARDVFVNDPCLNSDTTTAKINLCANQYWNFLTAANVCSATDLALKCIENAVRGCGSEQTKVTVTFTYKFIKPQTTIDPTCNLKEPDVIGSSAIKQTASVMLLLTIPCLYSIIM